MEELSVPIKSLMTSGVVSVLPDTPLVNAVNILISNGYNGLPVTDKNGFLVGILTEYDLILKGSSIHLPTFIKLMKDIDLYKKDKSLIQDDLKQILEMKVSDVMNTDPLTLPESATVEDAAKAFSEHHRVNPIPIIDPQRRLMGIVSRYDMIKMFGAPALGKNLETGERKVDKNMNQFIRGFEKNFILVSKARTNLWLIMSVLFALVGYAIAWFLILRVNF